MEVSKIQLSANESELILNKDWILTKHRITDKVYQVLGAVAAEMQTASQRYGKITGTTIWQNAPKISKGEQYEQLPYMVLDYPRVFSRQDVFAIRNFFWWGNYFSTTLHLKGSYAATYAAAIAANKTISDKLFIATGNNEFNFNIEKEYACSCGYSWPSEEVLKTMPFIKLTIVCPLQEWNLAVTRLACNTEILLQLLS